MLVKDNSTDVATSTNSMRIYTFEPQIADYPNAKFPGIIVFTEIYQVTEPVARFARQIASQGYIVAACSTYHEFTGPEPLPYDEDGKPFEAAWDINLIFRYEEWKRLESAEEG